MDPAKLTAATADVVNSARALALEEQHQQLSPLHLAVVMCENTEGVARQAVLKIAGEEGYRAAVRSLRKALAKLPKIEPPPEEVYMGIDLKKAFSAATKMMKDKSDAFMGKLPPPLPRPAVSGTFVHETSLFPS
jgi:ATP-dependent Clp protease ATP-binding subunit ClpB